MKKQAGFTLIELLVVIAVIGILASVVLASLNSARDKAKYAKAISEMREIAKAAELEVTNTGMYPPDVGIDTNPGMTGLSSWPKPPCTGWTYDWENWWPEYGGNTGAAYSTIRVTLRRPNVSAAYYYCITTANDCVASYGIDIRTVKTLSCNQ